MKSAIERILIFCLGVIVGWVISLQLTPPKENTVIKERIDTLVIEVTKTQEVVKTLKDSIKVIERWKVREIDNVMSLPTDSGVEFLKEKLRKYENNND
jgi:hypothetical protein